MLKDAGDMMYTAYKDYKNFVRDGDEQADQWIKKPLDSFNQKMSDIVRKFKGDIDSSTSLAKSIKDFGLPIGAALEVIKSKIDQTKPVQLS